MSTTEKLGLTLPTTETNWGEILNTNFEKIDDEFASMETELLGSVGGTWADLAGSEASLKDRLAVTVAADGTSTDYDRSKYSRLASTTTVDHRIAMLESMLFSSNQSQGALTDAPPAVTYTMDDRIACNRDAAMFDTGVLNRWYSADIPGAITVVAGDVTISETIYCILGRRVYKVLGGPSAAIIFTGIDARTTYLLTAQTWEVTTPGSFSNHTGLLWNDPAGVISSSKRIDLSIPTIDAGVVGSDIIKINHGLDTSWGFETSRYYGISIYNRGGIAGPYVEIYGRFPCASDTVDVDCISMTKPPYFALHALPAAGLWEAMLEIALTPGVVPIGMVDGISNSFTAAYEYTNMSKYIWLPGSIWAEGGSLSQNIAFDSLCLIKNIVPMVRCLDGEIIIPNEYGISTTPHPSSKIYINRRLDTYVCKRPSTGDPVLAAEVESLGVMVEI